MVATLIFDLQEALPKRTSNTWIQVLIGFFVGVLLALSPLKKLGYGFNGFLFFPALYVAIAFHEIGHLVAGSLVGMPPGALVIGGLVIFKSGDRWLIRFDYRRIFGGGLAKALPQKDGLRLTAFAWMVGGGPIASLLLLVSCAFLESKYGDGTWAWIGTLFWIGLLITIFPLMPFSSGLNKSDGARLWTLMRRPGQCRSWMALWALQTEETRGVVPRDWDAGLVSQMLMTDPSASEYPYVQLLAFYRCMHENRPQVALEHLENALARSARSTKVIRQITFLEAACCSALVRKNVTQARTWLQRAGKVRKPLSTNVAEATIAICEKRYDDALRFVAAARTRIERRKLDSGLARFAREKLAEYDRMCEDLASDLVSTS